MTDPRHASQSPPETQQQPHPGLTNHMDPTPDHGEDSYVGSGRLDGRRALITGGDSGIGRAVAIAFAREGADVAFTHLPEENTDAEVTDHHVRAAGRSSLPIVCDVRDEQACERLVADTVEQLGGLDIIVNNAAYQMSLDEGIAELTSDQLRRTFETNVFALCWIVRSALDHLSPGSSIINVTSIQARQPSPQLVDYAATKAAIVNLTANLAQQLADRGIRVNAVAPGPVWTPLIPATMPPEAVGEFGQNTPLGRVGQPAELAPTFVFLASDDATYITGETVAVTGGRPFT